MDEEKKPGEELFPKIQRGISNFLFDQEGNIPRNKILTVGSMMVLLSVLLAQDAFAKHTSHSSHRSHSSHSSHSSGSHSSSHESHVSHQSHVSHSSSTHSSSHSSHSSASDHSSHASSAVTHTSHSSHSSGIGSDTGTGTATGAGSETGTTGDLSTYPASESVPSLMEIAPPQIPQPNQVSDSLPDLTGIAPIVPDTGSTPDFSK